MDFRVLLRNERRNHGLYLSLPIVVVKIVDSLCQLLMMELFKFCDVLDDVILFEGKPDFSDNPRALFEYLQTNGFCLKYRIYFKVKDKKECLRRYSNEQVKFLSDRNKLGFTSFYTLYIASVAKYTFSSHGFTQKYTKYKTDQKHILLWHGCGYKDKSTRDAKIYFDIALVPGDLFVKPKCKYWDTSPEFILTKGYPRYDWILHPSEKAIQYATKMRDGNLKLVIWMPTYRNSKVCAERLENEITGFPLMKNMGEWENLDYNLKSKGIKLLVKLHISQIDYNINFSSFTNIQYVDNEDFDNANVQLYEFLACTDGLITDYSSVAIDYLLVDKPIGFTLGDFETYQRTRGFVFDDPRKYMPGHHIYNYDDLLYYLSCIAIGKDKTRQLREEVRTLCIWQCNCYCKEIVRAIQID